MNKEQRIARVVERVPIEYDDIPCCYLKLAYINKIDSYRDIICIGVKPDMFLVNWVYSDYQLDSFVRQCRENVDLYRFIGSSGRNEKLTVGSIFYTNLQRLCMALINKARIPLDMQKQGVFQVVIDEVAEGMGVSVKLYFNRGQGYELTSKVAYKMDFISEAKSASGGQSTEEKTNNIPLRVYELINDFNKLGISPKLVCYGVVGSTILRVNYTEG